MEAYSQHNYAQNHDSGTYRSVASLYFLFANYTKNTIQNGTGM